MKRVLQRLAALLALPGALAFTPIAAHAAAADAADRSDGSAHASRRHAVLLSLGATLVPVAAGSALASNATDEGVRGFGNALMIGGIVGGPSVGHFQAGCPARGFIGIGIRGGTLLAAVAVLATVVDEPENEGELFADLFEVLGVAAVAGIVVTTSAVVDIATAGNCRRPVPEPGAAASVPRLQLVPMAGPRGAGLALRATF